MNSRAPITFRHIVHSSTPRSSSSSDRLLQSFPPERYSDLVRQRGGKISVPRMLKSSETENKKNGSGPKKLTKLLLNVHIERSVGSVQIILAPENTVRDLIKAAIEIYVKEKRRPLLKESNPDCFGLHYSQFSLEIVDAKGSRVPPLIGWHKLNIDGSFIQHSDLAAAGGLVRGSGGEWCFGYMMNLGNCSVLAAELWGLFFGLLHAWDYEIRKLQVNCDNLKVIHLVNLQAQIPLSLINVVSNVKKVLGLSWQVKLQHERKIDVRID